MEKMLTLCMLLPVVLGANPYRKFLKDATFCQEKDSVCKMASGNYGCCPAADGVCCADGDHCCPSGFKCDLSAKQCLQYGDPALYVLVEDMLDVTPIGSRVTREISKGVEEAHGMQNSVVADSNVCPNGYVQCPDDMTCCATKEPNEYSCCPGINAVCCSTGMYCCPEGYECNNDKGTCVRNSVEIAARSVEEGRKLEAVICPDRSSQCPNRNTCCKLSDGNYACCPLVNAVCCSDQKHCCPHGYTCNVTTASCTKVDAQLLNKKPIVSLEIKQTQSLGKDITCPDDKSKCPDKDTCCLVSDGVYGCCPQQNATCCADKKHCCPHSYICDKPTGTCMKAGVDDESIPLQELVIKTPTEIVCPDGGKCPDGDTCCLSGSDHYGCCPVPNAMCCSDNKTCCPAGYTCDVGSGTCSKGAAVKSLRFLELIKSLNNNVNNVICPGNQEECPDGNTCCVTRSGAYGCCPVPNANCCDDHEHCCPSGFTCDVADGTCTKSSLTKVTSDLIKLVKHVEDVTCPGGFQYCPTFDTCCPNYEGGYSCCPESYAVCCSDGVHCCPNGYYCDFSGGCSKFVPDCEKENCPNGTVIKTDLIKHVEDNIKHDDIVVCPDGTHYCPDGNTCCLNNQGSYSCCPDANAVCCSDHIHCCPSGYSCDVAQGTCNKLFSDCEKESCPNGTVIKTDLIKHVEDNIKHDDIVVCPDGTQYCPNGNTCCQLLSGSYGCCPVANAVCCSDGVHCCPSGYTCDTSEGCVKTSSLYRIPFLTKSPTTRRL